MKPFLNCKECNGPNLLDHYNFGPYNDEYAGYTCTDCDYKFNRRGSSKSNPKDMENVKMPETNYLYSIIHYKLSNENSIDVGAVVYLAEDIKFIINADALKALKDPSLAKMGINATMNRLSFAKTGLDKALIGNFIGRQANSIRLSEPKTASAISIDALLNELVSKK